MKILDVIEDHRDELYPNKSFGCKWYKARVTEKGKAGVFSAAEDAIIWANWEQFQKVSDWISVAIKAIIFRIKFLNHLVEPRLYKVSNLFLITVE